jgi:DNA polymerase I-like protein with 3'-5' exonuclease and polymerase domains
MPAIITMHPTYAFFHNPYEAGTFIADVERLARMVNGTLAKKPSINPKPTWFDLNRLIQDGRPVSVDVETGPVGERVWSPEKEAYEYAEPWTGKDPTRCRLRTIGFGNADRGISFAWRDIESKPLLFEKIRRFLGSVSHLKLFHNGPWFDIPVLERHGFKIRCWRDTRDFRRALSNTSRLSLRYLTSIATDTHNWKDEEKKENKDGKGVIFTRDLTKLKTYNAYDCVFTSRVDEMCLRDLEQVEPDYAPKVRELYRVHRDLSVAAADMFRVGIHVNTQWRGFMLQCVEQEIAEKTVDFLNLVYSCTAIQTPGEMRCNHNDMRALIYKRHNNARIQGFGLPDPLDKNMWTNEDQTTIAVDVDSLLLLLVSGEVPEPLVPIIDAFWAVEEAKKRRGYLASDLVDKAIGPDGRLRPGWNSCGTDTMRFSCSEPNVMNMEQLLRHMFAPAPGHVIVHGDKAQLELRMMEAVSGDTFLYDLIQSGDVYSRLACEWFKRDPATFDKKNPKDNEARKASKIIYLARQYRAGLKAAFGQALREDRRFTFDRVRVLVSTFDRSFQGIVAYWEEEMQKVQTLGYSEGRILGGRHHYPAMPDPSEVANKPIQRTASEMMNVEMLKLKKKLKRYVPKANLIIQLHDAFDVEARERDERVVSDIMEEVMGSRWTIEGRTRDFPVELKVTRASEGGTWADV